MDTKWIENAFENAEKVNGLDPDKKMFIDRFPAMFLSFLLSHGPDAAQHLMDAMMNNDDVTKFICLVFACGMIEGKRAERP